MKAISEELKPTEEEQKVLDFSSELGANLYQRAIEQGMHPATIVGMGISLATFGARELGPGGISHVRKLVERFWTYGRDRANDTNQVR